MLKLGIITDEVSQDLNIAAEFAVKHSLTELEIRSVNGKGPFEMKESDILAIKKIADEHNLNVAAISAPLFKCSISDKQAVQANIDEFSRLASYSKILGNQFIRGFDFWNEGASLQDRVSAYASIIKICEQYGITCVIEYDPSVHSSTAAKTKELIEAINSPYIKALYDPGNGLWADENDIPYPNDYELLKQHIAHIHIKDADLVNGKIDAVKVGTGKVDYKGLIKRLLDEHYSGCVMLETHYRKEVNLTEEQLKLPGGAAFSAGAYEASEESIEALLSIINQIRGN